MRFVSRKFRRSCCERRSSRRVAVHGASPCTCDCGAVNISRDCHRKVTSVRSNRGAVTRGGRDSMPKTGRPERDSHRAVFFRSWLRDPFNVASVAPSSRWLAKLMATGCARGRARRRARRRHGHADDGAARTRRAARRTCSSSSSTRISSPCCARAFRARPSSKPTPRALTQPLARSARQRRLRDQRPADSVVQPRQEGRDLCRETFELC